MERTEKKKNERERKKQQESCGRRDHWIIGGVLMMLANIIIHMRTTGKTPDPGWIDMPGMLPGITEILAVFVESGLWPDRRN